MANMKQMMPVLLLVMVITIVGLVYLFQGLGMHAQVALEEAKFHALQADYFTLSKAERDGAATGSELSQTLVRLSQYPSELIELKLVGVGRILTGIFALLFVIGIFLFMMPFRIAGVLRQLHHETKGH